MCHSPKQSKTTKILTANCSTHFADFLSDMKTPDELIDALIDLSFAEDIGDGDHTTLSTIGPEAMGRQHLLVKKKASWPV